MNIVCIICKNPAQLYFVKKTFHIMRCQLCGLMFVGNVPEDLRPFYSEGYFTGDVTLDGYMDYETDKAVTKKSYQRYLEVIAKHVPSAAKVRMFEVGCATGFFLELAKEKNWEVSGNDLSEYAVKKAQEKGLNVTIVPFADIKTEQAFETIVMYDVIEHVPDPVAAIQHAYKMLVNDGVIVFTTPDASSLWAKAWGKRWHAFVPPQHIFYFSKRNLQKIVEEQGFEVVYISHTGKSFAIPYIFRLLYSWTGLSIFSKIAKRAAQSFLKNIAIHLNVRDTLFMVARKKKI